MSSDMIGPVDVFRAGLTRRWHSNPDMCHVVDPVAEHSGRVARIILAYHGAPSANLLRAALTHDDGEALPGPGDVSYPVKTADPDLSQRLDALERTARTNIWIADPLLTDGEKLWLEFADRLDAYMMVQRHRPDILDGDGWPEALQRLRETALHLGVVL